MREILFRAKNINNGEWREGGCVTRACKSYILVESTLLIDGFESIRVDPETVCQYTGLTDKNGRKIFEGDIVRYQFDNDDCPFPNKHTEKIIGRIFFSDWRASFSVTAGRNGSKNLNNDLFKYVRNGNRVEVLGNIFDNVDL